jgi:hypothetical protein
MTDDDEAPAGLAIPKQYPPPDARALALLARLVPAGADGLDLPADDLEAADALRSLTLARPGWRPGAQALYLLTTSWHRWEATRMLMEAPDALDDWAPTWWPPGDLERLADVLAPAVGIELGRWCAASVAGLEVADANRWPHVPG